MTATSSAPKTHMTDKGEETFLCLQGGGALGSYQAGVYDCLHDHGYLPNWVAGVSIGAINGALIAGNAPENRVPALKQFWHRVSQSVSAEPLLKEGTPRRFFNELSAMTAALCGVPGFYRPRPFSPHLFANGTGAALSYYDTQPLRETLLELIDFDRLNDGSTRLSVGAVNVRTGNYRFFDTAKERLGVEHILASGALPPGFAPIKIQDDLYWDGGLVSNTPLQVVLDEDHRCNACVFQVDLFSAHGGIPHDMSDVYERDKEIRYSSRTRLNTDFFVKHQAMRNAICKVLSDLPDELAQSEEAKLLKSMQARYGITIAHLIRRRPDHQTGTLDFEFSRQSVEDHWADGLSAAKCTLDHPQFINRNPTPGSIEVLDLTGTEETSAEEPIHTHRTHPIRKSQGA